jgi:hypothetical protein
MTTNLPKLLEFLRYHRYAVAASNGSDGAPQAALVGYVANARLELFFDSFGNTRKTGNLLRDPRIALVIGGTTVGDERTVQYEGTVDTPSGSELHDFQRDYFSVLPDGRRRSKLPDIRYFRVRPHWIRYSDYNVTPPLIVEYPADAIAAAASA